MAKNDFYNKRTPGAINTVENPGPYVATVIEHLDPRRSGSLRVQLESNVISGPDAKEDSQIITARYLMPFYGVTDYESNTKNDEYQHTQQSYGMWMVPPDPGTKVLVIFAEGQINQAYWMGCIQDEYMNNMVPDPWAGGASTVRPPEYKDKPGIPAGEYNKKNDNPGLRTAGPDGYPKPYNPHFTSILDIQGLTEDPIRGTTTTSSRRNLPSSVFGVSTPGPLDKRPGSPKGKYGPSSSAIDLYRSRLGGQSIVMDDGDPNLLRIGKSGETPPEYADVTQGDKGGDPTIPANELVRIRTRTGHQILMHNSEDLIYIGNARGTTWIELTSNGKIDIYAQDSISMHTERDFNVKADGNIYMEAGGEFNVTSGASTRIHSKTDIDYKADANMRVEVGSNSDKRVGLNYTQTTVDGNIYQNGPEAAEATEAVTPQRTPDHEPWADHENLNPTGE
jgi:hypothetical protein